MYFRDIETSAKAKAEYNQKHREHAADRAKRRALRNKAQKYRLMGVNRLEQILRFDRR